MHAAPRALVTRPAHEAAQWTHDLCAHGIQARALPLIGIRALSEPALRQALEHARHAAASYDAVMFVSPNAVRHFFQVFEQNPAHAGVQPQELAINIEAWAPGPGTAQALLQAGVAAHRISAPAPGSAQFDSEALWPVVSGRLRPGARVLVVRGADADAGATAGGQGRPWLAQQLAGCGAVVDFVAAYGRCGPSWDEAEQALARAAAGDGTTWLLSSSEALAHLAQALPGQDWSGARALATHARIAQAARAAGFGRVHECRPTLADVAASIKSLHER